MNSNNLKNIRTFRQIIMKINSLSTEKEMRVSLLRIVYPHSIRFDDGGGYDEEVGVMAMTSPVARPMPVGVTTAVMMTNQ